MNIPKAIEINKDHLYHPTNHHDADTQDALALGIEALDWFQTFRQAHPQFKNAELPSEDPIIDNSRSLHSIKKVLESPLGKEPAH